MRHLLSFATSHYADAQQRLGASAERYFDRVHVLGPADLDDEFRQRHASIMQHPRGYGLWIWKPHLILMAVLSLAPDAVLMYCDSQVRFIADPRPLMELCRGRRGVLVFHQRREKRLNREWCKRDCFIRLGCDSEDYWNDWQLNAAMSLWMNTPVAIRVLEEWLAACSDEQALSDAPSVLGPELPEFIAHRHDQAVCSLICRKRQIVAYPDPSQFGNGCQQDGRDYQQIVQHDRTVKPPYTIPPRRAA